MRTFYFCIFFMVVCHHSDALSWRVFLGNLKLKMNIRARMRSLLVAEVSTADIRLVKKDPNKTPDLHPLLQKSRLTKEEATRIFATKWAEYSEWNYDLDSEYKPIREASKLFQSEHYNSTLSTIMILHDRCGSVRDTSVAKILEAMKFRNYDVHYNILLLDFHKLLCHVWPIKGLFRIGIDPQLRMLGNVLATVLHNGVEARLLSANQIHLLGLGFSTHLAGLVARGLHALSGLKIKSILGLDPPVRLVRRLVSTQHAEDIHIYHTYTRLLGPRLGMGTADFVFDGAKMRLMCNPLRKTSCSSLHGTEIFISTLLYPNLFPFRWCRTFRMFTRKFCDVNEYVYISYPPDPNAKGTYQTLLDKTFPFGKGSEGIFMTNDEKSTFQDSSETTVVNAAGMSDQEFVQYLEGQVNAMRTELLSCLSQSPAAASECVVNTQRQIRRLVDTGFITRLTCVDTMLSPTGKTCTYTSRADIEFDLPF